MKACPQCGNVNDATVTNCVQCDYNFDTGEEGTKIPRVIADDDNIIRKVPKSASRVVPLAIAVVVLAVAGIIGAAVWNVQDDIEATFEDPFQIEIPDGPTIEIPTNFNNPPKFTRATCTKELSRAVPRILLAQAAGEPVGELFTEYTRFGVGSFEYRALLRIYGDIETQTALASGNSQRAVKLAKKNAVRACREEYGG